MHSDGVIEQICPQHWLIFVLLSLLRWATVAHWEGDFKSTDPGEDASWLRSYSDPGKIIKKTLLEIEFMLQDICLIQATYFLTDLNCANDTTGHDRESPRDGAHSQFELRHVRSAGQHAGQTVRTRCVQGTHTGRVNCGTYEWLKIICGPDPSYESCLDFLPLTLKNLYNEWIQSLNLLTNKGFGNL